MAKDKNTDKKEVEQHDKKPAEPGKKTPPKVEAPPKIDPKELALQKMMDATHILPGKKCSKIFAHVHDNVPGDIQKKKAKFMALLKGTLSTSLLNNWWRDEMKGPEAKVPRTLEESKEDDYEDKGPSSAK